MPRKNPVEKAEWDKEYRSRPEVKARNNKNARARYHAGGKVSKSDYDAKRRATPEHKVWRPNYQKERRLAEWAKVKLAEIRYRASQMGVPFDLDEADLVLPKVCPIFGTPLVVGTGRQSGDSPSIDRVDNTKGYVKGNVVVVSLRANAMKGRASLEELRQLLAFYEPLLKDTSHD